MRVNLGSSSGWSGWVFFFFLRRVGALAFISTHTALIVIPNEARRGLQRSSAAAALNGKLSSLQTDYSISLLSIHGICTPSLGLQNRSSYCPQRNSGWDIMLQKWNMSSLLVFSKWLACTCSSSSWKHVRFCLLRGSYSLGSLSEHPSHAIMFSKKNVKMEEKKQPEVSVFTLQPSRPFSVLGLLLDLLFH